MASKVIAYVSGPTRELVVQRDSQLSLWTLPPELETRSPSEIEFQLYYGHLMSGLDSLARYKPKRYRPYRSIVVSAVVQRLQMPGRLRGLISGLAQMAREIFPFGRRQTQGQDE
jgi:hypothetical protein